MENLTIDVILSILALIIGILVGFGIESISKKVRRKFHKPKQEDRNEGIKRYQDYKKWQ